MMIVINGNPPRATAQEKGVRIAYKIEGGRRKPFPMFYDKPEVKEAWRYYWDGIDKWRGITEIKTIETPVRVSVNFYWSKTGIKAEARKVTKPDLDNSLKVALDCLTRAGIIKDDNLITEVKASKWWTPGPGRCEIYMEEVE